MKLKLSEGDPESDLRAIPEIKQQLREKWLNH